MKGDFFVCSSEYIRSEDGKLHHVVFYEVYRSFSNCNQCGSICPVYTYRLLRTEEKMNRPGSYRTLSSKKEREILSRIWEQLSSMRISNDLCFVSVLSGDPARCKPYNYCFEDNY